MVSRRIWTLRGWRSWPKPWPEMLILGFSSGWPQLFCTPTHRTKCLYGLDKSGVTGLLYSWEATPNRKKANKTNTQKNLANLGTEARFRRRTPRGRPPVLLTYPRVPIARPVLPNIGSVPRSRLMDRHQGCRMRRHRASFSSCVIFGTSSTCLRRESKARPSPRGALCDAVTSCDAVFPKVLPSYVRCTYSLENGITGHHIRYLSKNVSLNVDERHHHSLGYSRSRSLSNNPNPR